METILLNLLGGGIIVIIQIMFKHIRYKLFVIKYFTYEFHKENSNSNELITTVRRYKGDDYILAHGELAIFKKKYNL